MGPPSSQQLTKTELEGIEKLIPWLKNEIPDVTARRRFCEWITDFADRHGWKGEDGKSDFSKGAHPFEKYSPSRVNNSPIGKSTVPLPTWRWTKMTPKQLYGTLDSNHAFYEKVMHEIEKNATTEFQAGHRFWPKKENVQNAKETTLAAIVVGSTYGIDPLFIITIAGYESQFANVKGIGGTGVCQVNEKSSSVTALGKPYGRKTWLDKVNETLDATGSAQINRTPKNVNLSDIFQNVEEAARTMVLKATEGGGGGHAMIVHEKYKSLASLYNGKPDMQNIYAENVMKYYEILGKAIGGG